MTLPRARNGGRGEATGSARPPAASLCATHQQHYGTARKDVVIAAIISIAMDMEA